MKDRFNDLRIIGTATLKQNIYGPLDWIYVAFQLVFLFSNLLSRGVIMFPKFASFWQHFRKLFAYPHTQIFSVPFVPALSSHKIELKRGYKNFGAVKLFSKCHWTIILKRFYFFSALSWREERLFAHEIRGQDVCVNLSLNYYLELQAAFRSPNQIAHYVINKVVVETVSDGQNLINFAPFWIWLVSYQRYNFNETIPNWSSKNNVPSVIMYL